MKIISYNDLEKHFTAPIIYSPLYGNKIPRKLKKKVKKICGIKWKGHTNAQRMWYYMGAVNSNYRRFLIKHIVSKYNQNFTKII